MYTYNWGLKKVLDKKHFLKKFVNSLRLSEDLWDTTQSFAEVGKRELKKQQGSQYSGNKIQNK